MVMKKLQCITHDVFGFHFFVLFVVSFIVRGEVHLEGLNRMGWKEGIQPSFLKVESHTCSLILSI